MGRLVLKPKIVLLNFYAFVFIENRNKCPLDTDIISTTVNIMFKGIKVTIHRSCLQLFKIYPPSSFPLPAIILLGPVPILRTLHAADSSEATKCVQEDIVTVGHEQCREGQIQ